MCSWYFLGRQIMFSNSACSYVAPNQPMHWTSPCSHTNWMMGCIPMCQTKPCEPPSTQHSQPLPCGLAGAARHKKGTNQRPMSLRHIIILFENGLLRYHTKTQDFFFKLRCLKRWCFSAPAGVTDSFWLANSNFYILETWNHVSEQMFWTISSS